MTKIYYNDSKDTPSDHNGKRPRQNLEKSTQHYALSFCEGIHTSMLLSQALKNAIT